MLGNFAFFLLPLISFKINFWEKIFQEYHNGMEQFVSKSGSFFCQASSRYELFAKGVELILAVNSNQHQFCITLELTVKMSDLIWSQTVSGGIL